MELNRTAYYRYLRGATYQPATTKQEQLKAVEEIFWQHKRRYGQRRILVDLQELGYSVGRHRVRRHSFLGYKSPLQFESDYNLKLASQL